MLRKQIGKVLRVTRAGFARLKWHAVKHNHESVYFYTLHKCASSLFGSYVLDHLNGLRKVDYELDVYLGKNSGLPPFRKRGFVYGPIRLSYLCPMTSAHSDWMEKLTSADFISDKLAIFLIRDPRDILVSSYYSFGFTHDLSDVGEIAELQTDLRMRVRAMTLDEWVIKDCQRILESFEMIERLANGAKHGVVLKYEDLVNDWDRFRTELARHVEISDDVFAEIHRRSRPRANKESGSHHRSGKSGQYASELKPETIERIDRILGPLLGRLGYSATPRRSSVGAHNATA